MMTDQKRQSQPILSVDFLTALPLDECRARLQQAPARGQRVALWDDNSFTVRCCDANSDQASVRFWGTLEARERGTWVWGTSIEAAPEHPEWPSRRTSVIAFVLVVLAVSAWTLNDARCLGVAAALLIGVGLWRAWTWRRRHYDALQVVRWVWETLYVPVKESP
jgi:hypothetical protein